MSDKKIFGQRFAQMKWRNRQRSKPGAGQSSPAPHNTDTHAGLDAPRAAFHAIKRKVQHTDEVNPENAAVDEVVQDGKEGLETTASDVRNLVGRQIRRKRLYEAQGDDSIPTADTPSESMRHYASSSPAASNTDKPSAAEQPTTPRKNSMYMHDQSKAPTCYGVAKYEPEPVKAAKQAQVAKRAAATAGRQTAVRTSGKITQKTTKAAASGVKAAGKGAAAIGQKILAAIVAAWPVFLILLIVVILLVIFISPMGIFYSNNEDNPNTIGEMVPQIEDEWLDSLAVTRQQYEDQGYIVTVNYGVASGDDGSRVNNWKDCLALYSVHKSNGEMATLAFDDGDKAAIHDLFFAMNPISVEIRTEIVETEVQRDVTTTKWVWNESKKKFEQVTVTEKETVIETEEIHYADIWVNNLRYLQMLGTYPLSDEEISMVDFLMDYQHDPLWRELGISTLPDDAYPGDLSDLIQNLPPGQFGSAVVELALSRLGHPYSMELRGQGNYIDCSGLTQWCYAQVGISLPNTAADQAKWCADNGKVIDVSAAQPGDLIFYTSDSARVADRYMKIGHVGVYAGNGMMVDASSSKGCVVYRAVYGSPVMWARPG